MRSIRMIDAEHADAFQPLATACDARFALRHELARSWVRLWIVESEGDAVALLVAWLVADELQIIHLGTAPAARRRGHAAALLAAVLDQARAWGLRLALLEVRAGNEAARKLYAAAGFSRTRLRRGYYADNGEDAIEMALELEPRGPASRPSTEPAQ